MRHILLSVACPVYQIFPYYLTNGAIFEKKRPEAKMYILNFRTKFPDTFFILIITERDVIIYVTCLHVV